MKDLIRLAKQVTLEQFLATLTETEERKLSEKSGSPIVFWLNRNRPRAMRTH